MKSVELSKVINTKSSNINLMRFLAAILVIFCHSFYVAENRDDPLFLLSDGQINFGGISVAIFFFLSGFYVTKSIYSGKSDIGLFIKKRCIRIFPQLWLVVLLSVFVLGTICTEVTLSDYFSDIHTYLYLLNGVLIPVHDLPGVFSNNIYGSTINGPLWTMPIEFFGYIVIAIFFWIDKKNEDNGKQLRNVYHIMTVLTLLASIALLFVFSYIIKNVFLTTVVRAWVFFVVGMEYYNMRDHIKLSISLASVFVVILLVAIKLPFYNFIMILLFPYIILTIGIGIKQITFDAGILKCSYEMYLVGWPVQQILTMISGGSMTPFCNFIITIPIDIIIGYVILKTLGEKV